MGVPYGGRAACVGAPRVGPQWLEPKCLRTLINCNLQNRGWGGGGGGGGGGGDRRGMTERRRIEPIESEGIGPGYIVVRTNCVC